MLALQADHGLTISLPSADKRRALEAKSRVALLPLGRYGLGFAGFQLRTRCNENTRELVEEKKRSGEIRRGIEEGNAVVWLECMIYLYEMSKTR